MCHEFDVRPNLVMQEELFVIVAAMVTRLGEEALSNHLIIPVSQAFSYTTFHFRLISIFGLLGYVIHIHG